MLGRVLGRVLGDVLGAGTEHDAVTADAPLMESGSESLRAVELRDQLQRSVQGLEIPILGYLRDTQNYVQLAAHGLTLWDVAPSRVAASHARPSHLLLARACAQPVPARLSP